MACLTAAAHFAVGVETIAYYLGYLPPRGVVLWAEVWLVALTTWFARTAAWVAVDNASLGHTLYVHVEGAVG